jgi:Flp pilus assembly protein TadD
LDANKVEWAAWMLLRAGDWEGALSTALSVLGLDPSHKGALRCMTEVSLRSERLDHATVWATRAAEADPGNARQHMQLARVLLRRNLLTEARRAARAALDIQPDFADALSCLAEIDRRLPGSPNSPA